MYPAVPPARGAGGGADPAAGAALLPEAGPATADPGPAPIPDPSPTLPGARRPRPVLLPDLGPGPGPGPGPGAAPPPPKKGPGPDLKASPSQQQKMEMKPRRCRQQVSVTVSSVLLCPHITLSHISPQRRQQGAFPPSQALLHSINVSHVSKEQTLEFSPSQAAASRLLKWSLSRAEAV